jgi:hypothetical protein
MMRYVRAGLLVSVFVLALGSFAQPGRQQRIVAIGDVHGEYDGFVGILQRAHLIDPSKRWAGGNTILVQTGDVLDRGPGARSVMDLLMSLQKDAPRQSGRVVVLLGNHEAMNLYGDLRYVNEKDYAQFVTDRTPSNNAKTDSSHPPGYFERCAAFDVDGIYGKWLRTLPAIARIDDSIFIHGGISPDLASWGVDKLNERIAGEIKLFDGYKRYMIDKKIAAPCSTLEELTKSAAAAEPKAKGKDAEVLKGFLEYPSWLTIHEKGPLWFRGYAEWDDTEGNKQMDQLTQAFEVTRFIVGHTVQKNGEIVPRFKDRVYLIDTGMLSSFFPGGRASALNIQDGKVTTIY